MLARVQEMHTKVFGEQLLLTPPKPLPGLRPPKPRPPGLRPPLPPLPPGLRPPLPPPK